MAPYPTQRNTSHGALSRNARRPRTAWHGVPDGAVSQAMKMRLESIGNEKELKAHVDALRSEVEVTQRATRTLHRAAHDAQRARHVRPAAPDPARRVREGVQGTRRVAIRA